MKEEATFEKKLISFSFLGIIRIAVRYKPLSEYQKV